MSKRITRAARSAALSAVAVAIASSGVSAAQPLSHPAKSYVLTIGTSVPLNSGLKPLADGINKSVELAALLANQKHLVPGVTWKVQELDDTVGLKYSGDKDASNADKLIASSSAVGEVGPLNSGAAEASMPVYNRAGLVQISPANTLVLLTDPASLATFQPATAQGKGPRTYFRTAVNDKYQGAADARMAAQVIHAKTVYVVDNKDPYATGVADQFELNAKKLHLNVLGRSELEPNQPQMGARAVGTIIKNASGGNVDLVFFGGEFGSGGGAEFLIGALRAVGLRKTIFMGPDGIFDQLFIKGASPAVAEGSYASNVGYPANAKVPVPPVASQFARAFKKQFPGVNIAGYDTESFDAANAIIFATANAVKSGQFHLGGSIKANRQAIAKQVAAIHFDGATGPVRFDKNGDTSIHPVISLYKVVNGVWKFAQYGPGFAPR